MVTAGHTRIEGQMQIDGELWRMFVRIYQRGMAVIDKIEREQETAWKYEVTIRSFGRPSQTREEGLETLNRMLTTTLGDRFVLKVKEPRNNGGVTVASNGHA